MNPRSVTSASGCTRWACGECGLSRPDKWTAMVCCTTTEIETVTEPDTPAEHVLEDTVTLDYAGTRPDVPQPRAAELLGRAAALMHERGKTYDKPEGERSMGRAVAAFNAVAGRNLSESEGWMFMQQLKLVRLFTRSDYHADSAEDNIAYSALLAEAKGEGR